MKKSKSVHDAYRRAKTVRFEDPLQERFEEEFEAWKARVPAEVAEYFCKELFVRFRVTPGEEAIWSDVLKEHIEKMAKRLRMSEEEFLRRAFTLNPKRQLDFFTGKPVYGAYVQ